MKKSFYLMAMLLLSMSMVVGTSCSDSDDHGDDGNGGGGNTTEKLMPVKIRIENTSGATAGTPVLANEEVAGGDDVVIEDGVGGDEDYVYYGSWSAYDLTWQDGKLRLVTANRGDMETPTVADPDARVQYAFTHATGQVTIHYSQDFFGTTENHVINCVLNDKGYITTAEDKKDGELYASYKAVYNADNGMLEKFRVLYNVSFGGETPDWEDIFSVAYASSENFSSFYAMYDMNPETYEFLYGDWNCTFGQQANNMIPNMSLLALTEGSAETCLLLATLAGLLPASPDCVVKRSYSQQYVDYQWTKSADGKITGLNISGKVSANLDSPAVKMTFSY